MPIIQQGGPLSGDGEDPDGALIEFVETHKLPILKKLNYGLDLRSRPDEAALPRWVLRGLELS